MRRSPFFGALLVVLTACARSSDSKEPPEPTVTALNRGPSDPHSSSDPAEARTTRLRLKLRVDFDARVLAGTAEWEIERRPDATRAIFDARDLNVAAVKARGIGADGKPTERVVGDWTIEGADPILGSRLIVPLAPRENVVSIAYSTAPSASGLQWLSPAQTRGKKRPYLFTQAQAIHARSFVPCQDTPGVRFTYEAEIEAPEGLVAVMSAVPGDDRPTPAPSGRRVFRFKQERAIPAYLLALAVGDLEFRAIGPRTGVWSEPSLVAAAASEFRDLEAMVDAVEEMYGPYRFGRYDVLVLPPSFPFGGMENPNMTFATPTLLAGDRSLVSVIAHELAHSWSGNLVTNADWSDFWLNEGFTVYLERRIVEKLYGKDVATRQAILGKADLLSAMRDFKDRPKLRRLKVDLSNEDPDDGMNSVPYEKGCLLLTALERAVGRERFDPFLRAWFDERAFKASTTADFVAFVKTRLPEALDVVDLDVWIYGEILPPDAPTFDASVFAAAEAAAKDFVDGRRAASALGAESWTTDEWLRFLFALPARPTAKALGALDAAWKLTDRGNAEIAAAWLGLSIRADYSPAYDRLEEFLLTVGRRKFLKPLYAELLRTPAGRARAVSIYERAREGYHPIARSTLDRMFEDRGIEGR
jgi:leukotriene-A4 hydrolase